MRWSPAPVVGGSYADDTKPWSSQDTVNLLPLRAEKQGTRSEGILRSAPGLSTFAITNGEPIRGAHNAEGKLLVVAGNTLYRINFNGSASEIGTIPGATRVSMAHNQITDGNEVMIATGQDGYVYNTVTDTLAKVTDEGFPGFKVADFVDGYIAGIEPGGRFWLHSNLAAATDYNTIDRYEGETSPDKMVSLIVSHREVVVLSERTLDIFGNTGQATGTFDRIDGKSQEVGCASTHSVAVLDSAVWWLGDDGSVYRMFGGPPERISTQPIEQAIAGLNWSQAFAQTWEDRGHKVYYLTFPDGMTWGFDVSSGEWHRRQSFGLNRWRMNTLTYWNSMWIVGDFSNGKLYRLDWESATEGGEEMSRERTFAVLHNNQNRVTVAAVELVLDVKPSALDDAVIPIAPSITGDAQNSEIDEPYSYAYTVVGEEPLVVSLVSGTLPPGLTLSSAGVLTGTPTVAGTYPFTLRVTDAFGLFDELDDTIGVFGVLFEMDGSTNLGTANTSLVVNFPAYMAGDLLVMTFAHGILTGPGSVTAPAGWTEFGTETGFRLEARWYWKIADGSEGASVSVTTDSGHSTAQVHRIASGRFDAIAAPEIATALDNGPDIDAPALTPTWGSDDTIWLITGPFLYNEFSAAPIGYPYTDGAETTTPGFSGTFATLVASCYTVETTATLTPGAFDTNGGDTKAVATIGIKPA